MTRTVVLVLDYAYQPCEIIDWTRALTLLYLDKAEIVEDGDDLIRSANSQHRIPAVIRKLSKRTMRNSKVSLNKINLFLRDQFTCQYCLLIGDKNSLTVDHVIPRSIGGKTTWDNVTTACYHCNQKKAWRSPKEAGMILNRQPKEPSWNNLVATRMKRHSKEKWKKYYE